MFFLRVEIVCQLRSACRLAKIASVRRDSYASSEENLIASENGSFMGSWTATRGLVEQQVQCLGDKVDSQADQLRTKIDEQGDKIESLYGEIKLMQGILLLLVLVLAFAAGAAYTSGQNALFGLAG